MSGLLFQPQAGDAIKRGIDTLAEAVRPTLGPDGGSVALDDRNRGGAPELLDDGGVIARRILQLPDRGMDVGAMLLRETLWEQRAKAGDGAATAAVLYQTVYAEGHRFIRAGGDAMLLRRHLEHGLSLMLSAMREQIQPIRSQDEIRALALSVCGDEGIADALADIFDALGPHQPIETRDGGRELTHDFYFGSYWDATVPADIVFQGAGGGRLELKDTAWLVSDFALDDLNALVKLVTDVYAAGFQSLVIVAKSFSEQINAALGANAKMPDFTLVYLQLDGLLDEQEAALDDLALLTGGQVARVMHGHSFDRVTLETLGKSELAWVDRNRFGLIAAGGDERLINAEVAELERLYRAVDDERRKRILRWRIGRLRGGSAVVYAGGSSESEMRYQKARIERTIATMREGLLTGVLPGGGTALLRCLSLLREKLEASDDADERAAWRILTQAAATPCESLLLNAGHEAPGVVIDAIKSGSNGAGYDVRVGELADMRRRGIVDSAAAVLSAARAGIGGAALALTIDAIVQRKNPPLAIEPGGKVDGDIGDIELV